MSSPVSPDVPRARLRGGASHEPKGRRGARGGGAGRLGPPGTRRRLCVLRQILHELVASLEQFLLVDDVVAVEDGAGLVAGQEHGDPLGHAGADQVAGGGAAAIVEEAGRHAGRLTGGAPRRAPAADGDAVAVEDQRAVGVAACPPSRQGLGNRLRDRENPPHQRLRARGREPDDAAGLAHLWGTPTTDTTQVLLIAGITGMALTSVVSGMEKGVKRLSEANLLLALLLLVFVLTIGPTFDIATGVVTSLGQYLAVIGPLSNWVGREDLDFMHGWTTFFWAWWISWSPFVGLFVARASRGRTVRELIACMLIIPTLLIALWMNAFGGTAVSQYVDRGHLDVIAAVQAQQPEIALFALLETLPLANVTSVIGVVA